MPKTNYARTLYLPGLLIIGIGAWHLIQKQPARAMVVINVITILFGLCCLAFARLPGKLVKMYRDLLGGVHTFRPATEKDLKRLDRKFYEAAADAMKKEGYRFLEDVVDVTTSNSWPKNHAVLRVMLGDSGTTMCAAYHVKLYGLAGLFQKAGLLPKNLKIVECETELSDKTFVTTANSAGAVKTTGYPFQDRLQFPLNTSPQTIACKHREHLQSVLAKKKGVTPVLIADAKELRTSQDRMQLLKCAHRNGPNFDHRAEWESVAGRPLQANEREMVNNISEVLSEDKQSIQ